MNTDTPVIPAGWAPTDQASSLRALAANVAPDVTYVHRSGTRKLSDSEASTLVSAEIIVTRLYWEAVKVRNLAGSLMMVSPEFHGVAWEIAEKANRLRELVVFMFGIDSDNGGGALQQARNARPQFALPPTDDAFAASGAVVDDTPDPKCTCATYPFQTGCALHNELATHGAA